MSSGDISPFAASSYYVVKSELSLSQPWTATATPYLQGGDLVVKNVFGGLVGSHPLGYRVGAQVVGHDFDRRAGPGLMQYLKNEEEEEERRTKNKEGEGGRQQKNECSW